MNSSRLHVKSSRQTSTAKGKAEVPSRHPVSDRSLSNCSCSRTRAPDVLVVPFSQLDLFDGPFDLFGRTCGATTLKLLEVLSSRTFCHSPGWCVFRFLFCNLGAWFVKISRILLFFWRGVGGVGECRLPGPSLIYSIRAPAGSSWMVNVRPSCFLDARVSFSREPRNDLVVVNMCCVLRVFLETENRLHSVTQQTRGTHPKMRRPVGRCEEKGSPK